MTQHLPPCKELTAVFAPFLALACLASFAFAAEPDVAFERLPWIRPVSIFQDTEVRDALNGDDFAPSSPHTLMQWSYGASAESGPNLDEPLATDRPDFIEASSTVGLRVAQLEFGYTYTYDSSATTGNVSTHSWGEPLLRYGVLANWLEFRLAVFPVEQRENANGVVTRRLGTEDLYLGVKIGLTPQEGILPEMALVPQINVPLGFGSPEVEPGVNWLYSWDVTEVISAAGSTQANRRFDDNDAEYVEFAQALAVGCRLSERLSWYAEWYAFFPSGGGAARTEHYLNGGFAYLLSNDVQFDIRAGVGLNEAADDYFLGTGLSIRYY